ncbi:hypothetical protein M5689_016814 [Euphorbia peplus]|nr:hypothetical protein M5689_016814 [Euphorbia peplus]
MPDVILSSSSNGDSRFSNSRRHATCSLLVTRASLLHLNSSSELFFTRFGFRNRDFSQENRKANKLCE